MQKTAIVCILLIATGFLHAQKDNHLEVCFGIGPSFLVKGSTADDRWGHTEFGGLTYCLQNKKRAMAFTPGIYYLRSLHNARVNNMTGVSVQQYVLDLRPSVRLRLAKHATLRVGINFMYLLRSEVAQTHKNVSNSKVFYYSTGFDKGYSPQKFQASVQLGLGVPFRIIRRMFSFNIEAAYYASRLVRSDFVTEVIPGQKTQVLYTTSRPLALLLGFDIDLRRMKKKKTEEE